MTNVDTLGRLIVEVDHLRDSARGRVFIDRLAPNLTSRGLSAMLIEGYYFPRVFQDAMSELLAEHRHRSSSSDLLLNDSLTLPQRIDDWMY